MNTTTKTLQELGPGDPVRCDRYRGVQYVERVTPTQVVVRGDRYRRSDGRQVGDERYGILPYTPDERRQDLAFQIGSSGAWYSLTLEQLERIQAVLDEPR